MSWKTVLIDDEKNNNALMEHLISLYCPKLTVIKCINSFDDALVFLNENENLVVFLDINLNSTYNGIDLLEILNSKNHQVIIVSAHQEYALDGYRYNVLDYLLKPIKIKELLRTYERIIEGRTIVKNTPVLNDGGTNKISLHLINKIVLIDSKELLYIESKGHSTLMMFENNKIEHSRMRIGEVEQLLGGYDFYRIHKSYLVNKSCVKEMIYEKDQILVQLTNESKLPVARRKKSMVKAFFEE